MPNIGLRLGIWSLRGTSSAPAAAKGADDPLGAADAFDGVPWSGWGRRRGVEPGRGGTTEPGRLPPRPLPKGLLGSHDKSGICMGAADAEPTPLSPRCSLFMDWMRSYAGEGRDIPFGVGVEFMGLWLWVLVSWGFGTLGSPPELMTSTSVSAFELKEASLSSSVSCNTPSKCSSAILTLEPSSA